MWGLHGNDIFSHFHQTKPLCYGGILMFKTIITLLNGDREITSNRQSTATDVIDESSTPTIPVKFRNDIGALKEYYAQDFREGLEICLSLKDALVLLPRHRARTSAYNALAYWLKDNLGITLTIKSQKSQKVK